MQRTALFSCVSMFLLLCSCAPRSTFILLPQENGGGGSRIVVQTERGMQLLDRPYTSTAVWRADAVPEPPRDVSVQEVEKNYGTLLAALPQPPRRFILYFLSESMLTPESGKMVSEIADTIRARRSADTSIIGHTDTSGAAQLNYELSRKRAEYAATILTSHGIDRRILEIDSHGETNLLIPTPDDTVEPGNRRVEVIVR